MEDLLMYHPTITKMLSDERIREYTARAAPRRPPAAPCAALPLDARAIHVAHRSLAFIQLADDRVSCRA
jgi:hypothetical protein